jgi:hypothetical protein
MGHGPSWFETRSFAALLTMRISNLARFSDLILRSIAKRGVSKDESPAVETTV